MSPRVTTFDRDTWIPTDTIQLYCLCETGPYNWTTEPDQVTLEFGSDSFQIRTRSGLTFRSPTLCSFDRAIPAAEPDPAPRVRRPLPPGSEAPSHAPCLLVEEPGPATGVRNSAPPGSGRPAPCVAFDAAGRAPAPSAIPCAPCLRSGTEAAAPSIPRSR